MELRKFFDTAWERHRIYVLKEMGMPKPWTENPILRDNYFCNVFRLLDKTSKWIVDHAIDPNDGHNELWKTIIMCRYISRIQTLEILEKNGCLIGQQKKALMVLRTMQLEGHKIFTNAFIVNSKTHEGWSDKVSYLFKLIANIHHLSGGNSDAYFMAVKTMEDCYRQFRELPGVGDFMAYQYTVDFTYSKRYLYEATDQRTWTSLGLGAVRGLNRTLGNGPVRHKIDRDVMLAKEILYQWIEEVQDRLEAEVEKTWMLCTPGTEIEAVSWMYEPFMHLKLREVEHWLCEYDKYMRGGSKKRAYNGKS